jgi:hypothetical protein
MTLRRYWSTAACRACSMKSRQLASEFGVAIVVVHHTRKSAALDDPFEKVSGTQGLAAGAADTTIVLSRDSQGATLYGRGRDIPDFDVAVVFDAGACKWRVLGEAVEVRRTDERNTILAALKAASGEGMTPREIAAETGMKDANVRKLLGKMVTVGEALKAGHGRYLHAEHADKLAGEDGAGELFEEG